MNDNEPATKKDVEEIVGRVVGEIASSMMQLISERFDQQEASSNARFQAHDKRFDEQDKHFAQIKVRMHETDAAVNRIENKLNPTIELVDDHSLKLKRLRRKAA